MFLFALLSLSSADTPSSVCAEFTGTDCASCLDGRGKYECGFCIPIRACIPGNNVTSFAAGPCFTSGPTAPAGWSYSKSDEACRANSSVALPENARIGVGVAVAVIAVVTLIFWVWVFPRLFAPPERGLLQ